MAYEHDIASDVDRLGWSAVSISDVSPPFVYTVGLMFSLAHPELIVFGLAKEAYSVLRALVEEIRRGCSFAASAQYDGIHPRRSGAVATTVRVAMLSRLYDMLFRRPLCQRECRIRGANQRSQRSGQPQ